MSDIQYSIYFDLASAGYRAWGGIAIGATLLTTGIGCLIFHDRLNASALFTVSRTRLYAFTALAFICTAYAAWSSYSSYFSLVHAQRSGKANVAEGIVRDFRPQTSEARGFIPERFCVQDSCFEYSNFSSNNQFNTSRIEGGPIKDGLRVRVTSYQGKILKLEIAK